MSTIVNSVCKLCRRENLKLFLKGERCFTDKCAFERRPYPPGQHGQQRLKFSEYALQLREKQKIRRYYGIHEETFKRIFKAGEKEKGETGFTVLKKLETRFDNVVYLLGLAGSRREGRHFIKYNHFMLNGKRVNLPNVELHPGDVVEVKESSRQLTRVMASIEAIKRREIPSWLEADHANFKGTVKEYPTRDQIGVPCEENMLVEFYSR